MDRVTFSQSVSSVQSVSQSVSSVSLPWVHTAIHDDAVSSVQSPGLPADRMHNIRCIYHADCMPYAAANLATACDSLRHLATCRVPCDTLRHFACPLRHLRHLRRVNKCIQLPWVQNTVWKPYVLVHSGARSAPGSKTV